MYAIIALIALPLLVSLIHFIGFVIKGRCVIPILILRIIEIAAFLILPFMYASLDTKNNCCGDSAAFSPDHQLTIWTIVVLCLIAYFYSSYRNKIAPPVIEIGI
jgi:hypothetical protein